MAETRTEFDPYLNDPLHWGASMAHHAELMLASLETVGARSIVEVGAYAGDLTRVLADWASGAGARVLAVDPSPQPQLVELAEQHPEVELVRQTSLEALPQLELPDAFVIDGDHNYYTVREELRLIGERAEGAELPLLLFHDVCWPHGRRDDYFDPEGIPADYRQPLVGEGNGIFPTEPGTRGDGLPYPKSAAQEGGERNGVLTAVEDFVADHDGVQLVVVPAFFGFGAAWHVDAPWAAEAEALLRPWNRHPLLARLEANRIGHIAEEHALRVALWQAQERISRQERLLHRLLESSAFTIAERLSKLRARAGIATEQSVISRAEVERALSD